MRIFYKQLLLTLFLFGGFVAVSAYFILGDVDSLITQTTSELARTLSEELRSQMLQWATATNGATAVSDERLARFIEIYAGDHPQLREFQLYDAHNALLFSRQRNEIIDKESLPNPASEGIRVLPLAGDALQASWRLETGRERQLAVAVFGWSSELSERRRRLMMRLYLICVAGVVCAILLSLLGNYFVKGPVKRIEKAMLNIENRRYGFRLKGRQNDEFKTTYNQVNRAMVRLEQLDSVQRSAVRRKNMVLNELKTISRFLDVMAHEIKNPLHALVINIDVLKTKLKKSRIKAETKKHVSIIELEVEHLREVIDGFLNYVRPGVPQRERIKLNQLIQDVCEMASAEAGNSNVVIETRLGKGLPDIFVDKRQVQQALHNVVKNGLQCSSAESKLLVRSWGKGKHILASVRDTGPGIPRAELKKIFDLYFTTKKGGSGLGLPITKRIVEANGGEMQLESKVGKGTTVTFKWRAA